MGKVEAIGVVGFIVAAKVLVIVTHLVLAVLGLGIVGTLQAYFEM